MSKTVAATGHTTGALLAVVCSTIVNHDIVLAIVHYFCSWFYVAWAFAAHYDKLKHFFRGL
jgi:hypothetical protein